MDLLERELRSALDRAATAGVSGQVRLRNPALVEAAGVTDSMAGMKRSGRWLIVASAAMTVTAIAAVVAVGTNRTGHRVGATDGQLATASPAKSSSASPTASPRLAGGPGSDGVHTLWHLAVPPAPTRDVGGLPLGAAPEVPKPYVVLPGTAPDLARYPTLVTADGPVEFKGAAAVFLVGSLPQGVLVATTGLGHDGQDGMRDVHLLVVGKGNVQREIFHGPAMLMASVAPDGATVAVNTWLQDASAGEVDLVDVASATITHRLPGQFTDLGWAANDSLLLIGPGESPKSYAWGTPWSAAGARALGVDLTYVVPSAKGLIGVNQSLGCLERLDASLNVVEASCGGWSAGPLSPDGRYVDVVWQSATDASKRVGVLDTTTDQVVNMSVVDGGGAQWLGQGKVLLTPQAANNGGDRANPSPDSAVCVLASDTCERVPAASFTRLFQAAEWLGK
jgi:hypothetical protein